MNLQKHYSINDEDDVLIVINESEDQYFLTIFLLQESKTTEIDVHQQSYEEAKKSFDEIDEHRAQEIFRILTNKNVDQN